MVPGKRDKRAGDLGTKRAFAWTLIMVAALMLTTMGIAAVHDYNAVDSSTWSRWDSGHYIAIADEGYEFFHCRRISSRAPENAWCGNTGWFMAYPLLMRALGTIGIPLETAGVFWSSLFFLIGLGLVWRVSSRDLDTPYVSAVAAACVFFGSIYYHAVFPVSLLVACMLGYLHSLFGGRTKWAVATGVVAGFSYGTGFLLAASGGAWFLLNRSWKQGNATLARGIAVTMAPLIGFGLMLLVHHFSVGVWDAFFMVQAKYEHGLHSPFEALHDAWTGAQRGLIPHIQTLCVSAWVGGVALVVVRERHTPHAAKWLTVGALVVAYWLFPLVMGRGVSLYRAEALLLPSVLVLGKLPPWGRIACVVLLGYLYIGMAPLFFMGRLV